MKKRIIGATLLTVVCALTVGFISRFFCKRLAFLVKKPQQTQLSHVDVPAA